MPLFGIRKNIKKGLKSVLGLDAGPTTNVPEWTPPAPSPVETPEPEVVVEPVVPEEPVTLTDSSDSTEASETDAAPVEEGMELTMENVEEVIDDFIRPGVQADGGNIELIKIEHNDVYVRLTGACQSCSSAIMTMKMGVEALLREEFPSMRALSDETDYAT